MDPRLPDAAQRRYMRNTRHSLDLLGMLLVVTAGVIVGVWVTDSAHLDATGLATLPASLGFTMWSGHPSRGHPGSAAPLLAMPQTRSGCDSAHATFVLGLAELKGRLGEIMGDPLECEQAVDAEGNTRQHTTTGLAEYSARIQTVTFSDGRRRWALTGGTLTASDSRPLADARSGTPGLVLSGCTQGCLADAASP